MKLSAPVYRLRRQAKLLARERNWPLHKAQQQIAEQEGFNHWSLLVSRGDAATPAAQILQALTPGDLVLLGARPQRGKTLFALELAIASMQQDQRAYFYSLDATIQDVQRLFAELGEEPGRYQKQFVFDDSDSISADYLKNKLASATAGSLVVIDYLQALDQQRQKPQLMTQVRALRTFAKAQGLIMVFLSQIDRAFEGSAQSIPSLTDVRLPNPLDLSLFDQSCFLGEGQIELAAGGT